MLVATEKKPWAGPFIFHVALVAAVWGHPWSLLNWLSPTNLLSQGMKGKVKSLVLNESSAGIKVWTFALYYIPQPEVTLSRLVSLQSPREALGLQAPYHLNTQVTLGFLWESFQVLALFSQLPGDLHTPCSTRMGPSSNCFLCAFITAWESRGQSCFVDTTVVVAMVCKNLEDKGSSPHGWIKQGLGSSSREPKQEVWKRKLHFTKTQSLGNFR